MNSNSAGVDMVRSSTPAERAMEEQEKAISMVQELVSSLSMRLQGVMSESRPVPDNAKVPNPQPTHGRLVAGLIDHNRRLENVAGQITDILDRLEV